jgi:hypothetical protein
MSEQKLRVILVTPELDIRNKLKSIFYKKENILTVIDASNIQDISTHKPFLKNDIIIWQTDISTTEIEKTYTDLEISCHLICSKKETIDRDILMEYFEKNISFISFPIRSIELTSLVHDLLERYVDEHDRNDIENPFNMYPIQTNFLLMSNEICPYNIYLRIHEKKYVMIVEKDFTDYKDIIQKYISKGIKEFFITHNDYNIYKERVICGTRNYGEEESEDKLRQVNQFLQRILLSTGVTAEAINLANNLSTQITKTFSKNRALESILFDNFKGAENQFCYNHSYLTSIVCTYIANKMGWNSQTIIKKLIMASLIHDSSLDTPELVVMHDLYPEQMEHLDKEEKELIHQHGPTLSNILLHHIEIDNDVLIIIKNSHEDPCGTGYPLGADVNKLSSQTGVFLISHEFVVELYKCNFDINKLDEIVTRLFDKYNHGNFDRIASEFQSLFSQNKKLFVA